MFVDFQFGNFRSFRDEVTLSMRASLSELADLAETKHQVFEGHGLKMLKCKAIYGQNASGKSNIAKAISAFATMVHFSVSREDAANRLWANRFQLAANWDDQPVYFQYIFFVGDTLFRYGFQILKAKVELEWLFATAQEGQEQEYFVRQVDKVDTNPEYFSGVDYNTLMENGDNEIFRRDALFLTMTALTGNRHTALVRNEIMKIVVANGADDRMPFDAAKRLLETGEPYEVQALKDFIRASDVGITDFHLRVDIADDETEQEIDENDKPLSSKTIFSTHDVYDDGNTSSAIDVRFLDWESQGTRKLVGIGVYLLRALREGRIVVIDEFDARFHPNLTLKIVNLFASAYGNPKNAQLIFVTHDSGLLRRAKLRPNQVGLIDKNRYGISTYKTLIQFQGLSSGTYEKEYLDGSYGSIPFLNALDEIVEQRINGDGI